jgi:hypothetical protein
MSVRQKLLIPNTTQVPNILLDKVMPLLPEAPLKVLLAIVRFTYGFQKRSEEIGNKQLTRATGLSRSATIRAVAYLGDLIHVKPGGPGKGSNEYALNLHVSESQLAQLKARKKVKGGSARDTSSASDTSVRSRREVVAPASPSQTNNPKPIKSVKSSSAKRRRRHARPADPAQLEAFNRFYQGYPRHVAKEAAWRAWQQLSPGPPLVLAIYSAVKRYAAEVEDTEARFIAYPATWLNGRRWEDEATANGNGQGPPVARDIGNGLVEVNGLKMTRDTYERKHGRAAAN